MVAYSSKDCFQPVGKWSPWTHSRPWRVSNSSSRCENGSFRRCGCDDETLLADSFGRSSLGFRPYKYMHTQGVMLLRVTPWQNQLLNEIAQPIMAYGVSDGVGGLYLLF